MAQFIDKDALVAEIERVSDNAEEVNNTSYVLLCNHLKDFINTLEVKEVDLDKEIEEHTLCMPMSEFTNDGEVEDYFDWAREEFRHFFELGLKAQKGE